MFSLRSIAAALVIIVTISSSGLASATEVTALASSRMVVLTGFTRARATLDLVAEEAGRIDSVKAEIGDTIGQDGIFARIDDTFIRLDLDNNRVQQADLRSRIDFNKKEAERYRELVAKNTAAQSTLDSMEQTLDASRFELNALTVQERILLERLERTRIKAPAQWKIITREVEPGQWVNTGQIVGKAGDFSTLLVPFALAPEQYVALRRSTAPLTLNMPELGISIPARVERVNPGFDPDTRKIAIDLTVSKGLDELRGGLRTILTLEMPEATGAVLLPKAAIEERYEDHWVTRDNGERIRVVLLGNHSGPDGSLLRVTGDGLQPGDKFRLMGKE
ncbi:efflux RND transporter periplasmic adaptor subunit [Desulfovibrio ferrophilus]|uniref:RND family efflux transporter, MFP subunit n=1 Tax=Desulfovibrio ferrophilus TaxID=241368 RepID=A0A2Z6B319_9BACT|nr:efflux RND transporter periplasmic adaptor subunit [Desulfovibrio ferrophilus]BBD09816.1 RND family efflux transporter, MFP subunit [Desulfovibrio ferrophilus]